MINRQNTENKPTKLGICVYNYIC